MYEPPYPPSYGLNSTTNILLERRLWHQITHEDSYAIKQKNQTDTSLLKTQQYKVRIKGKVEQSKEWSSNLPYTLVL